MPKPHPAHPCPCGSGRPFAECCAPALSGARPPATPEALMRSRYTAFALGDEAWLLASWHASTRPAQVGTADGPTWIGLQILAASEQGEEGRVEFVAHYLAGDRRGRLQEMSRFVREGGRWYYLEGTLKPEPAPARLGRNDPCPCGSGRKFKRCCGRG